MEQKFGAAFPHSAFEFLFYRAVKLVAMNQLDRFIQDLLYVLHFPGAMWVVG